MRTEKIVCDVFAPLKEEIRTQAKAHGLSVSIMSAKLLVMGLNALDGGARDSDSGPLIEEMERQRQEEREREVFRHIKKGASVASIVAATCFPLVEVKRILKELERKNVVCLRHIPAK